MLDLDLLIKFLQQLLPLTQFEKELVFLDLQLSATFLALGELVLYLDRVLLDLAGEVDKSL